MFVKYLPYFSENIHFLIYEKCPVIITGLIFHYIRLDVSSYCILILICYLWKKKEQGRRIKGILI